MTYYCDDPINYRSYGIFDLNKANKSRADFRDEDGDICGLLFDSYLTNETDSMLSGEEVANKLNELSDENEQLKKEIENIKDKERIKQHEELISEQAIQLDYLQDENKHMKDVLNENKQLQPFIELANKYDKTIDELYQFIQSYLNSRNENNYWNPKNLRG